jgi:ACR3 family arsenite transporter
MGIEAASTEAAPLGLFARYLSLWVALCILAGVALGHLFPTGFVRLAALELQHINLPVAILVWLMIVPMLLKVDFAQLGQVRQQARGIGVTLFVNWAIKPFSMALLGGLFVRHVFAPWLPADQHDAYVAGLVLLAAAPCTAMVFVWSRLCGGEANFTLSQVALNDTVMIAAFAPIVALLLGVASIDVPWGTLLLSVLLYIVVPVVAAQLWRRRLLRDGPATLDRVLARAEPCSTMALLATLVLLFGFQGEAILAQPAVIVLLAVPILIQVYLNAAIAYGLCRRLKVPFRIAGPAALIGASNFFELAVATAISLFGLRSGAALATVVGVLVEVPVMLSIVHLVNRSRRWYEASEGTAVPAASPVARNAPLGENESGDEHRQTGIPAQ